MISLVTRRIIPPVVFALNRAGSVSDGSGVPSPTLPAEDRA